MKTGEGKTPGLPAVVLNALKGEGVHLVTVNDYWPSDAEWMGPIYGTGLWRSTPSWTRRQDGGHRADVTTAPTANSVLTSQDNMAIPHPNSCSGSIPLLSSTKSIHPHRRGWTPSSRSLRGQRGSLQEGRRRRQEASQGRDFELKKGAERGPHRGRIAMKYPRPA